MKKEFFFLLKIAAVCQRLGPFTSHNALCLDKDQELRRVDGRRETKGFPSVRLPNAMSNSACIDH